MIKKEIGNGDVLTEVETDKATMEQIYEDGTLLYMVTTVMVQLYSS